MTVLLRCSSPSTLGARLSLSHGARPRFHLLLLRPTLRLVRDGPCCPLFWPETLLPLSLSHLRIARPPTSTWLCRRRSPDAPGKHVAIPLDIIILHPFASAFLPSLFIDPYFSCRSFSTPKDSSSDLSAGRSLGTRLEEGFDLGSRAISECKMVAW